MKRTFYLVILSLLYAYTAHAQMTARVVRDSLFIPWEITWGPDDHIWFTQKNGYICRMEPTSGHIDTLYHEPEVVIQGEGGMLGLALHPNFPTPPFVYVAYDYMNGSTYTAKVVKYQYDATNNKLINPQGLIANIGAANYHNGCRLMMEGNYLYITTGDATNPSVAQDVTKVNGKILRVVQDGSIPADNPMPGSMLWSWGHRNPQGVVYANNRFYETEHGPDNDDEVNIIQKGRNYGWPNVEGYCDKPAELTFCTDSNVVEPLKAWTPTIAVCGLDYYDHPMFPTLQKSLIMCTLKDSSLYQLKLNGTLDGISSASKINAVHYGRLRDLCISPDGRIFISTSNSDASGNTNRIDKIIELYDPSFNSVKQLAANNFLKIIPNPVTDLCTIHVNDIANRTLTYKIVNAIGETIASGSLEHTDTPLATTGWTPGLYFIQLRNERGTIATAKIIRQ
ncbi:MAG: hypothetical protein BGO70_06690 [Bacteroidetes bacterium 43-93]|nr:PQQ-dependent sugar dehydrogenase [Bacteroidota bacterium]OJW97469.1 MAG: hypothetical protein BGO70_06690 [Bacteroidetes bacterium 43-93]